LIKWHKGNVTPTNYLFTKKGRIAFEKDERGLTVDDVLDEAIEAGAEDVEEGEDGEIVVWTEAGNTTATALALKESLGLKVETSDVIWDKNEETGVEIDEEAARSMTSLLDALEDNSEVQNVYANVLQGKLSEEIWDNVVDKLAA